MDKYSRGTRKGRFRAERRIFGHFSSEKRRRKIPAGLAKYFLDRAQMGPCLIPLRKKSRWELIMRRRFAVFFRRRTGGGTISASSGVWARMRQRLEAQRPRCALFTTRARSPALHPDGRRLRPAGTRDLRFDHPGHPRLISAALAGSIFRVFSRV